MEQQRKLILGAVSLVQGKVRNDIPALTAVRDELEPVLARSGWFPSAPFKYVGLILRYGTKTDLSPEFRRIQKARGELPISVELSMEELRAAHRQQRELEALLRSAISKTLLAVAERYNLPKGVIEEYVARRTEA